MQSEMGAVLRLLLPGNGTIRTRASQHARAVRPLGYFNL
jgi:hypothetical protein